MRGGFFIANYTARAEAYTLDENSIFCIEWTIDIRN
jgi:hypothetical protein